MTLILLLKGLQRIKNFMINTITFHNLKIIFTIILKMDRDLILQILTKSHYLIPRETYLRIYTDISKIKTTFDNLEIIAIEMNDDLIRKYIIELVLIEINSSLTIDAQVTQTKIKEIIKKLDLSSGSSTGYISQKFSE